MSAYLGNIYILDPHSSQIYKYVSSDSGFIRQNYFSQTVDVSKGVSLTIDGSIWVLQKDGEVFKFTKGNSDSYSLQGLDKPFLDPTRITTSPDFDNYYVLDNGNQRIVAVNKQKGYVGQYQNKLLKTAKEFEISEKDKKAYFLSGDKIYSFDLP